MLRGVEPIIAEGAREHGVSDEDVLHAYDHPIRVFELDDGFTMLVGASRAAIFYASSTSTGSSPLSSSTPCPPDRST